jgi:hypothetical protein
MCGGYFLLNGIGMPGELEIGQKRDERAVTPGEWIRHSEALRFKVDRSQNVVLISCKVRGCVAENNIEIGTRLGTLLRRYGAPVERSRLKEGVFYRYHGVGFIIRNDRVSDIYIFPRFDKAK